MCGGCTDVFAECHLVFASSANQHLRGRKSPRAAQRSAITGPPLAVLGATFAVHFGLLALADWLAEEVAL